MLSLSLIARTFRKFDRRWAYGGCVPGDEKTPDGFADDIGCPRCVTRDAAIGPFNPAIARGDVGVGKHDEPAVEAESLGDLVELFAGAGRKSYR